MVIRRKYMNTTIYRRSTIPIQEKEIINTNGLSKGVRLIVKAKTNSNGLYGRKRAKARRVGVAIIATKQRRPIVKIKGLNEIKD